MKEKVILVDADGVLLDWEFMFNRWMVSNGYERTNSNSYKIVDRYSNINHSESKKAVKCFNESAHIGYLSPYMDAIEFVKKLHESHGYIFHCITSLGSNPYARALRERNLKELFGNSVFEQIVFLDTGENKDHILKQYRDTGCFWIEDNPKNAIAGSKLGLNSILMARDYNISYKDDIVRLQNWKEIYYYIILQNG